MIVLLKVVVIKGTSEEQDMGGRDERKRNGKGKLMPEITCMNLRFLLLIRSLLPLTMTCLSLSMSLMQLISHPQGV